MPGLPRPLVSPFFSKPRILPLLSRHFLKRFLRCGHRTRHDDDGSEHSVRRKINDLFDSMRSVGPCLDPVKNPGVGVRARVWLLCHSGRFLLLQERPGIDGVRPAPAAEKKPLVGTSWRSPVPPRSVVLSSTEEIMTVRSSRRRSS